MAYTSVPDPDIAGPGAMISFIVTGLLATLSSIAAASLRILEDDKDESWQRRFILRARLLDQLRSICPTDTEDPIGFWKPILEDFVLNLSDQQLISGLLIVTLAIPKYYLEDMTSAGIAADLGFFSMITHFATILTIQPMLRSHFKLAVLRIIMVFAPMILWLALNFIVLVKGWHDGTFYDGNPIFLVAFVTILIEIIGIPWIFWDVCLSLFMSEQTRKVRKALSRIKLESADREIIVEWLGERQEHLNIPRGYFAHVFLTMKMPLLWLFKRFCNRYVEDSETEQRFLWILAEICFPFRFGNALQTFLLLIGIVNLVLDLMISGLANSWGFGQLLPMFMLLLPFFSLAEAYAQSKIELEQEKEKEKASPLETRQDQISRQQAPQLPDAVGNHEMQCHCTKERSRLESLGDEA